MEAATGLAILGVILAVFVPTFLRELRTSKTAEAVTELERLHVAAATYYGTSHRTPSGRARGCVPGAAGPTPAEPSVTPEPTTFANGPHSNVWQALGYQPDSPVRFRYSFLPQQSGCNLRAEHLVTLRAEADLDGDGKHSRFERLAGANAHGDLVPIEILHVENRNE